MKQTDEIYDEVVSLISEIFKIKKESIAPESKLKEHYNVSSVDLMQFIYEIEEKFNIGIDDEEAVNLKDVQSIINCINEKIQKR